MSDDGNTRVPDNDAIRALCDEARDLIKRVEGSTIQRLTVQAGRYQIDIDRRPRPTPPAPVAYAASPAMGAIAAPEGAALAPGVAPEAPAAPTAAAPPPDTRHPIMAPLVGTFYRSNQPGAKPFVEEGDIVDKGQPLCIVEAMKIMNQVSADRPGRIAEVLVKDGDWVEFQQVLMYMEPTGS